jgi:hypothetical protein
MTPNPEELKDVTIEETPIETPVKIDAEEVPVEYKPNPILERIVPKHDKKSREVLESDINKVVEDVKILHEICFQRHGFYGGAYAMHHAQIDDKDPLNFFVEASGKIIINPVITRHSNYTVDSKEACMTFPNNPPAIVQRWHKCEVEYVTLMVDPEDETKFKFSSLIQEKLSGPDAFVFCHEYDHGQAQYIY